jgi:hypothetical protein
VSNEKEPAVDLTDATAQELIQVIKEGMEEANCHEELKCEMCIVVNSVCLMCRTNMDAKYVETFNTLKEGTDAAQTPIDSKLMWECMSVAFKDLFGYVPQIKFTASRRAYVSGPNVVAPNVVAPNIVAPLDGGQQGGTAPLGQFYHQPPQLQQQQVSVPYQVQQLSAPPPYQAHMRPQQALPSYQGHLQQQNLLPISQAPLHVQQRQQVKAQQQWPQRTLQMQQQPQQQPMAVFAGHSQGGTGMTARGQVPAAQPPSQAQQPGPRSIQWHHVPPGQLTQQEQNLQHFPTQQSRQQLSQLQQPQLQPGSALHQQQHHGQLQQHGMHPPQQRR